MCISKASSIITRTNLIGKDVFYIAHVGRHANYKKDNKMMDFYKYGISKNIYQRELQGHRKTFKTFNMLLVEQAPSKERVETDFTKELKLNGIHAGLYTLHEKSQRELFWLEDVEDLPAVLNIAKGLVEQYKRMDHAEYMNKLLEFKIKLLEYKMSDVYKQELQLLMKHDHVVMKIS